MNRLIVLAGPTGVGKTELSLRLAEAVRGEIVSCDSMQIYRGMDIGSAKASAEEQHRVPHHLLDIISPFEPFTVSDYKTLAERAIDDILSRGNTPILAGGTMLYIDAVIKNMSFTESQPDSTYRRQLEDLAAEKGNLFVHAMLKDVDAVSHRKIHPNNLKKVIRALEVHHRTGTPFSDFHGEDTLNPKYLVQYGYLTKNRETLYAGINARVDGMMERGLLEEVVQLRSMGLDRSYQSMQGIGYKELLAHLEGELTLEEAVERIKKLSRNYAKRQLSWYRNHRFAKALDKDALSDDEILGILQNGWK